MTHFEILEYLKHLETISYPTSRQSLRLFPWKFWQILELKGLCVTGFHLNIKGRVKSLLHFPAVGDGCYCIQYAFAECLLYAIVMKYIIYSTDIYWLLIVCPVKSSEQ